MLTPIVSLQEEMEILQLEQVEKGKGVVEKNGEIGQPGAKQEAGHNKTKIRQPKIHFEDEGGIIPSDENAAKDTNINATANGVNFIRLFLI